MTDTICVCMYTYKSRQYLDLLIISPSRAGAIEPRPTKVIGNNADRYPKINPNWPPINEEPNPKTVAITYCWIRKSQQQHCIIQYIRFKKKTS